MAPFTKPETVLKQAEGLVSVGQTHAALQSLTEMFSSKRFRSTPLASLEPIMNRFIELCVDMRKGRTAKDGLTQYKNIAQNTSVQSIQSVITRFIQLADAKVREAQEKAAVQVAVDVDDLEASETPESILLGAVSGDQSKDRTDRDLVTPWLKFLWESYRTSLETLKNNARLEVLYQEIAQQAFKFCLTHQRKVEFRRLCETLRNHLSNVAKYSHQPHSINLSDPDTLQRHLDTRFAQLNTSVELELWQEAFRSVEDVHNLLTMAKKAPRPAMMANYYEKLTKVFLMSGNALYHAAAWSRYYAVVTSIGGKSEEELSKLAGQVLVSALAVPVGLHAEEQLKGKNAGLIGLTRIPTRSDLLKDALSRNVLKLSPPDVKVLYDILEVKFDPLTLCSSIAPLLNSLAASSDPSYAPYLPLLHQALISRLLSHLSQVYSSIKISNLLSLIAPLKEANVEGAYDEYQIEAYIMGCARRGELNVKIDHLEGCITFIDEPFNDDAVVPADVTPVQPSMATLARTRLSSIALCLHNSLAALDGPTPGPSKDEQQSKLKQLLAAVEIERQALQLRRAIVARRRELISELSVRKEKEESSRRAEISRREKEEKIKKQTEELKQKEAERNRRERENIRKTEAAKYAKTLVDTGVLRPDDVEKMENFDTEVLISMQVQHLEKEKKETTHRLKVVAKRIDHLERAYRKEERPLLTQDYEQQQANDREAFETFQVQRKEDAHRTHQDDLTTKARLSRMVEDYEARKAVMIARKGEEFARKKDAAHRKITEEKAKRKKSVLAAREDERKRLEEEERVRRETEEEERRREEELRAEEERRIAEERAAAEAAEAEKRAAEEKAAATRKERERERAEADERARLQRQREEEAEARRAARNKPAAGSLGRANGETTWKRSSTPQNSVPPSPIRASAAASDSVPKYRPGAISGGGGWRARQEEAKNSGGAASSRPASPAPAARPTSSWRSRDEATRANGNSSLRPESPAPAKDDDGFQAVQKPGVWKARRTRP